MENSNNKAKIYIIIHANLFYFKEYIDVIRPVIVLEINLSISFPFWILLSSILVRSELIHQKLIFCIEKASKLYKIVSTNKKHINKTTKDLYIQNLFKKNILRSKNHKSTYQQQERKSIFKFIKYIYIHNQNS